MKSLNPWITIEIKKQCRKKQKLYYKYLKSNTIESLILYKAYKNNLTTKIKILKKKYYYELIDNAKNLKYTWKTINGPLSNTYILCNSFNLDNNIITNTKLIAKEFNTYFSNIGKKLDSSLEKTETNNFIKYLNIPNNSSFFYLPSLLTI